MKWFLTLLIILASTSSSAEVWSGSCRFTGNLTSNDPTDFLIKAMNVGCYRFVDTDTTSTSDVISIDAPSALWCFDPDNTDEIPDTARVVIRYCPTGIGGGSAGNVNTCISLGGANGTASLDGTTGSAATQNSCIRTGPGSFYIEVTAACTKTSPNYCQVSVKGEGD